MIKNIVFDMGNVLVRFDPELFMDRYSLTGEDRKLIRNEVFRSVEWTMLDRGVIDEEIAEQRILPRLPECLHDAACGLIEKWDDPIVPVEGMLELLQALKAKGSLPAFQRYHPSAYLLGTGRGQQADGWCPDLRRGQAAEARPADLPHLPAQVRPSPGGMRFY